MNRKLVLLVALGLGIILVEMAQAAIFISDTQNVAVPSDNGTSTMLNVSARMQQYVGFFGGVNASVKINTTAGAPALYNRAVTSGKIYFVKTGASLSGAIVPALNNSQTDGNFSLSGFYATGNLFTLNGTVTGVASVDYLLTTDGYKVGLLRDSAAVPNYFIGTDLAQVTSQNGMGVTSFQVIVPKTTSYTAYDVYIDLE